MNSEMNNDITYIQIIGKYRYVHLGKRAPVEQNPDVITLSGDEAEILKEIGVTKKFDYAAKKIVDMTEVERNVKAFSRRKNQIRLKLFRENYIHIRQQREQTLISNGMSIPLTMSETEYFEFCKEQNKLVEEFAQIERFMKDNVGAIRYGEDFNDTVENESYAGGYTNEQY